MPSLPPPNHVFVSDALKGTYEKHFGIVTRAWAKDVDNKTQPETSEEKKLLMINFEARRDKERL